MRNSLSALLAALLLSACASSINQHTAQSYYAQGERAVAAGNLQSAKLNFSRALLNAQLGGMGPVAEAQITERLARVQGNLCEHDEAESGLLKAVSLYSIARSPNAFASQVEVAQLNFDIGRFERAVVHFSKAFEMGGPLIESRDPASYALLLEDYAVALDKTGNQEQARATRASATKLRTRSGESDGKSVTTSYTPYPKTCPN